MIVSSRRALLRATLALAAGGLATAAARAQATDPAIAPVDAFYEALMDAMRHAQALKVKGRFERLEPVMIKSFDVPVMVRGAIGGAFNTLAPADQASLRAAFAKLLVATFASTFDDWKGEKFVVMPEVRAQGIDKFVRTQFVNGNVTTDINYLLRTGTGGWRIVDVYLNGNISQLATWRSQYGSLLQNGGPPALLRAVAVQTDKFMAVI